ILRISQNLQNLSKHVTRTHSESYREYGFSRPVSEAIERDDDDARMSDRSTGPVIRRARSARLLTSDHHHAASVSPPAAPHHPPYTQLPYMTRSQKFACPRNVHGAQHIAEPRMTATAPASQEEGSGCVNTPRASISTDCFFS
ncbi:hypothetical protein HDZ31DRAFT_45077, partial [Schizophyllum fasciatum]